MAVNMESRSFEPPPGYPVRAPHGSRNPRVGDKGPSSTSSNPPAVVQPVMYYRSCHHNTSRALQPNIIIPPRPIRPCTRTFFTIQQAPVQNSPSNIASTITFHQIQWPKVNHSPPGIGANSTSFSDRLGQEFSRQSPRVLSWKVTKIRKIKSSL